MVSGRAPTREVFIQPARSLWDHRNLLSRYLAGSQLQPRRLTAGRLQPPGSPEHHRPDRAGQDLPNSAYRRAVGTRTSKLLHADRRPSELQNCRHRCLQQHSRSQRPKTKMALRLLSPAMRSCSHTTLHITLLPSPVALARGPQQPSNPSQPSFGVAG